MAINIGVYVKGTHTEERQSAIIMGNDAARQPYLTNPINQGDAERTRTKGGQNVSTPMERNNDPKKNRFLKAGASKKYTVQAARDT